MIEFNFGDYCLIEQKLYGAPNVICCGVCEEKVERFRVCDVSPNTRFNTGNGRVNFITDELNKENKA